jgi:triacylglycerol lipase
MHHVYLIPGFFGFSNLGELHYFRAIRQTLEENFKKEGLEVFVPGVSTLPTGSLIRRAQRLLDTIVTNQSLEKASAIHLIGHSTGGLDARLLASSARDLGSDELRKRLREKLKTVVTISAPHRGTPLANFFTTIYGKNLLYFVTLLIIVGLWRRPISMAAGVFSIVARLGGFLGLTEPILRQLTDQLLKDFSRERESEVREFLNSILSDVSLMVQLTPESMEVFDRAVEPWAEVRYVSYATVSPSPLKALQKRSLASLLTPISTLLYSTLYTLAAQTDSNFRYRSPVNAIELSTGQPLPFVLKGDDNDGVVPTLSQIFGEFRGYIKADHLDVVGHFFLQGSERKDVADWFTSGANFNRTTFDALWHDVTQVLLGKR